ncbi:MAG: hypothetical protein QM783_11630 [Phycisphaerales bacterium]
MTHDHIYNDKLAAAQLDALEALHSLVSATAQPLAQDPARAKTTTQLFNIRLRAVLVLLRLKPRKVPGEHASEKVSKGAGNPKLESLATQVATPAAASLLPLLNALPPTPLAPITPLSPARALLERAGMPQHVPRSDKAA